MTVSFSTFERLKSKGVAAYKKGEHLAAQTQLADAAECRFNAWRDVEGSQDTMPPVLRKEPDQKWSQ